MMAPDRRRRSPEGSTTSRRHKDPRADYNEPPRMRATPQSYPYSSSSSSSNSIVDISHSFPPKRSGIRTFFTAPSERKLRKRRSSRLMKNNNSSSSSVSSDRDLAYGHGYIKRPKLRRVRSRSGREIDRERYNERHHERQSDRYSDREGGKIRHNERARESTGSGSASARGKLGTTAEILAVGAGLRAIASEQNKRDLREARNGKKPELAAVRDNSGHSYIESRGIGPSRVSHGPDEEGWESASDSESSVDSRLAFGNDTKGGWSFFGRKKYKPMSRKSSVVDPRLFGPANSLHGLIHRPVGFGDVSWTSTSDFGDQREAFQRDSYSIGPQPSHSSSMSQVPLQQVPPMPMSEIDRSEPPRYTSESQPYTPIRPDPIPIQLQHPKPFTPVSQSVYEPIYPTRSESGGILKKTSSSTGRGKSLAEVAVAGVAAVAVGSMISSARDDLKDRQREEEIDALERDRIRRRDSEKRESKDEGRRDKRSSPPREDRKDKRRDKDKEETEERRRERKRDERRGETRDEKEDRREKRREERRATDRSEDRYDSRRTKSEASVSTTSVDPFQFQVDQNAFSTPTIESSSGHRRIDSVPTVVTVQREPDFSRTRSSSIKGQPSVSTSEPRKEASGSQRGYTDWDEQEQRYRGVSEPRMEHSDWDEKEQRYRSGDIRDRVLHDAEATIKDAKHFTGPYDASVITAVVAAEHHRETRADERRRERQKDANYDDYSSAPRDKTPVRDPIQEEADRAYREIVMARKIASQVIRSRSPSPDPSVVHKYEHKDQEQEVIRIVTPPGMEEHKGKGPYDAPNADFRLDHVLEHPRDLQTFSIPSFSLNRSNTEPTYLVRDPDASKPRPLLNLVRPTPTPSPLPEKQVARSEPGRKAKSKDPEPPKRSSSSDIVIGPKGNIIASPTASSVSKGVTWGENETKHYEVESPSEHRDEFVSNTDVKSRDSPADSGVPKGGKGWGAVAAGIIGAGVGATAAGELSKASKSQESEKPVPYEYRGVVVEPESPPHREEYRGVIIEPESPPRQQRQRSPPSPGPKPTMPQSSHSTHMPGAFDDDLDFTAVVAAGLQDTGFDPNIVIDDPTFRRRDSPPGSNDHKFYQAPFAETVTDLGMNTSEISRTRGTEGFVISEVASTPKDWPVVSPTENDESYSKLSKKEQKKRDKAVKRQSGDSTPIEEGTVSRHVITGPDSYFEAPLSKKEQKKRDKAAKRQSSQIDDATPFSEPSVAAEIVQEPESYFETPKKSKKSKSSSNYDDIVGDSPRERTVSVPVDAFDDLQNGQDEWADSSKKSKKKSKRDSDRYESPASSAILENASELERSGSKKSKRDSDRYESPGRPSSEISSSGKKSKDKSSRRSGQFDYDPTEVALPPSGATSEISSVSKKSKDKSGRRSEQYEYDPTEVSLPPSTPSETSRDGDFEDARSTRRSSTTASGIFNSEDRGESRSVVSAGTSRYDDPEPRKKKKSRSGTDYDDTRSVASAPAGDDYEEKKGKKKDKKGGGIFSGLFGSKSESGARDESPKRSKDDFEDVKKKSKKSKRSSVPDASSVYGDMGSVSVNDLSRSVSNGHSNGNGSYPYDDGNDDGFRSDGEKRKKTRSRSESTSSKKDSFLGNAGTLGAGVGIAGVTVAAIAAQHHHQQSKAENADSNAAVEQTVSRGSDQQLERGETLDPEITQRQFRPSIDPQYGDLLPLPPSDPASPNVEPIDDLPNLPDSRPDTPESERLAREKIRNTVRRTVQDSPMKSPSQSQVPLKFKMGGNRAIPPSPGASRSSPLPSPANPSQESLGFQRHRSRPTSWDNSKEFKPLYLVESARRGSNVQLHADDEPLPELPPSQRTSRSSSQLEESDKSYSGMQDRGIDPLSIDTTLPHAPITTEFLESGQSTPKANVPQGFEDIVETPKHARPSDPVSRVAGSLSPAHEKNPSTLGEDVAEAAVAVGLVSTIGYFASTPSHPKTNESWLDDLPSAKSQESPIDLPSEEHRPYPVDPVTKDRSSYLLRSSPMSKKSEDLDVSDRNLGSPSSKPKSSMDRDALHSIEERELGDISPQELPHDVSQDREKALETLSGSNENVAQQPSQELEEPSDDFALKKSKKDKKKDKNGKGLSRSGTQDDLSLPEPAFSAPDAVLLNETDPTEEFFSSKSKKDKKGKKKNKSTSWEDNEPSQEISEPSLQTSRDEPDSDTFFDAEQGSLDASVPEKASTQQVDFSTPKTRKGKKDKKKKSAIAWEPEQIETRPEVIEESLPESAQILSDAPTSREIQQADLEPSLEISNGPTNPITEVHEEKPSSGLDIQEPVSDPLSTSEKVDEPSQIVTEETPTSTTTPTVDAQFDEVLSSKKKNKKDKRKSKATSDWDEPEDGKSLQQAEESLPDNVPESAPPAIETDSAELLFSSKSKKDKKKDKKKGKASAWEAEEDTILQLNPDQTETSRDASAETSTVGDAAQVDDFPNPKSKGKKGKKSKAASWEPDIDTPAANESQTPTSESRNLPEDTPALPMEESQPIDDFSSKSKKDKKKKQKSKSLSEWDAEDESASQVTSVPVSEPGLDVQEVSTTLEEPLEESSSSKKKDRKKDKRKSKSVSAWEPESNDAEPQPALEPWTDDGPVVTSSSVLKEPSHSTFDSHEKESESTSTETPQDPHRDLEQRSPILATSSIPETQDAHIHALGQPEDDKAGLEIKSEEPQLEIIDQTSANDDLGFTGSKKSKKKKGKSTMSWADELESSLPEPSHEMQFETDRVPFDTPPADGDFGIAETKKGKKKKNKSASAWEQGEETAPAQSPLEVEDPVFTASSSKKDKKKGKKSQQWDEPETREEQFLVAEGDQNVDTETFNDFTASSTKKGKKKSRKAPTFDDENPPSDDTSKSLDAENILPVSETPLSRPTPLGGPGGWPITPATPLTSGEQPSGEVPSSTSKGYFPAAAAAGSAAIFGSKSSQDDTSHSKELLMENTGSAPIGADNPPKMETEPRPTPDGLAAGYDNDQLSLARQLQEEFGKKASKKDKKKRQSLPSTPAVLPSRSRTIDDDREGHHRARSLSIGPTADRSGISPAASERKNVYSEDQLELARQLKADFESGSKKSKGKKAKKGRSTQDDDPIDKDFDPQMSASTFSASDQPLVVSAAEEKATPIEIPDVSRPDGFAAGYQEDQLSLARQMQAEFAKKASKKDKKRRSTSQPPVEQEPFDNDFGDQSQFPGTDSLPRGEVSAQSQATVDENLPVRDGLAVGYNAEQLELARQLKEEFGSGSKKKGKDKKDKKRGSLLRANTEDDFSSDPVSGETDTQQQFETLQQDSTEILDTTEEFSAIGKKSKKDDSSIDPGHEGQPASREDSPPSAALGDELSIEPALMEPDVEFASVSKKDKKSKKGKQRDNLQRGATDDDYSDIPQHADTLHSANGEKSGETPALEPPLAAEPEDDFAFSAKKSKKEKKKRQSSIVVDDSLSQPMDDAPAQSSEELPISDTSSAATELVGEASDDFGFSSKKKDKKKKRGSLLRNESFNNTAEEQSDGRGSGPEPDDQNENTSSPVVDEPQDDFEYSSSKKSKKDKKKRGSLLRNESFNISAEEQVEGSDLPSESDNIQSGTDLGEFVVLAPLGEEQRDDFDSTPKKSKKKRGSLPPNSKIDNIPEDSVVKLESEPNSKSVDLSEATASTLLRDDQEAEVEIKPKKSSKDKKNKRKSTQSTPDAHEPPMDLDTPSARQLDADEVDAKLRPVSIDEPSSLLAVTAEEIALSQPASQAEDENAEDVFAEFAFTKKSKKKDKKRKDSTKTDSEDASGFSTPLDPLSESKSFDEPPLPADSISGDLSLASHEEQGVNAFAAQTTDEPVDDWDDFSTKKSKKKKRKDSSKPDSEGISTPSEPILEPSKDVALTPLPIDQIVEDSVMPELTVERDLEPEATTTAALQNHHEEPSDEWGSFSDKKSKNKKDKKKQKGPSKTDFNSPSSTAAPLEPISEPSQPTAVNIPEEIAAETVPIELPQTQTFDGTTLAITKEIEEPSDDWGSFSTKKTKKGKKDKKSGSSTPIEHELTPASIDILTEQDGSAASTSQEPNNQEDDWGPVSSKKSKKAGKAKISGLSTPIEEVLVPIPEHSSLHEFKESSLPEATVPEIPEQALEISKEAQGGSSVDDDTPTIPDPFDEWGSLSGKKSKDKKKKRSSELSTTTEEASVPEHLGIEELGQSATPKDLNMDAAEQAVQSADTVVVTEEPGDGLGDFALKKSKKKKDKKQKASGHSTPSEEPPSSEKELPEVSRQLVPTEAMSETTNPVEVALDAKDASEDPYDDWASFSAKPSKKDRKKRKSGFSTPVEVTPTLEIEDQTFETVQPSDNQSADEPLQSEQPGDVKTKEVAEDQDDDWGNFSIKPSKKGKNDKSKRSSGLSTPVEQTTMPLAEHHSLQSHQPSIQSEKLDNQTAASIEEPANLEMRESTTDLRDEWGSVPVKQSKTKGKKNRKSGLSTPVEDPLPDEESGPISAEPVQEATVLSDTLDSSTSQQTADAIDEQDEWVSSTPKSKKDKKKSRQPGSSTPITESRPPIEPDPSSESSQSLKAILGTGGEPSQDVTEDLDDSAAEWGLSSKKSKGKKNKKSKLSIPAKDALPSLPLVAPLESPVPPEAVLNEASSSTQDTAKDLVDEVQADEWGTFPAEENKDKKKSGHSTPVDEPLTPHDGQPSSGSAQQAEGQVDQAELAGQETKAITEDQGDDNWGALSTKKGKKDKKRKSGLSTAIEEALTSLPGQEVLDPAAPSTVPAHTQSKSEETSNRNLEQEPIPAEEPIDEWGSLSKKKSKKDKKRKSGISTPIEEVQTLEVASSQLQDIADQPKIADSETIDRALPAHGEEDKIATVHSSELKIADLQEPQPEDDTFAFVSKKSKKTKKEKRKSGLSTPNEDEMQTPDNESGPLGTATQSGISISRDIKDSDTSQPQASLAKDKGVQIEQPLSDDFGFVPKKSKDKKGKKGSLPTSESGPSTPAQPNLPTTLENEIPSTPLSIDRVASPVLFENDTEEQDLFTSDLSRKLSKKDKRKRQAAVDVASEGKGPVTAPLTSWADEVEEAEVVRAVPVIQEIAKDESFSHIAPSIGSTPMDDFVRPSKKGKKGTKRQSVSTESTPVTDSLQQTGNQDLPKETYSTESSHIPALIATGAAIAGAALLGEAGTTKSGSNSGTTTPAKKLSKKDRKKKSIDRRAPREDDMFDDPALWEGADPKVHEEAKEVDDDSDGFWSPPQQDEEPLAIQEVVREALVQGEQSAFIPRTETTKPISPISIAQQELLSRDIQVSTQRQASPVPEIHSSSIHDTSGFRDLPDSFRHLGDPADDFVVSSSKKQDKKKKKSSLDSNTLQDRDVIQQTSRPSTFNPPTVVETPVEREISFDQPPISQEHIFAPPRDSLEQQHSNRDVPSQEISQHIQPRPQSRSVLSRLSDLPIVHEESSTQLESKDRHPHDADANRDSAFVTGSPIPPHQGFSDNHEHVRDSGVHLRDFSPAEKARAPVKSSDDAIARLSWPSVDEDSETVDLHRSQRSKDTKHHIEERPSTRSHDSKRPKGETATDFYRTQRSTPTKHHDEETSSRDLLPSQRHMDDKQTDLHRTPTIHGPRKTQGQSLVKQRMQQFQQFQSSDAPQTSSSKLSSSRSSERIKSEKAKDEKSSDYTAFRPIERSKGEAPKDDLHSGLPSSQSLERSKDDKYSETPPKSDRLKEAKYPELTTSPRPKAERPKGISEIEAGAVIAGASLGFAAARKLSQEQRPGSAQSQRSTSNSNINRLRTPDIKRPDSVTSNRSGTPPLRRSDRKSGDLRSLSQRSKPDLAKEAELATFATPSPAVNTANPTANEGRVRAKDMADVYDGFGEGRIGSPRSPTRPHSMRRRQSMQVLDLEQKLEQLAAENRMLAEAKAQADRALHSSQNAPSALVEKEAEIDSLKRTLEWLQNEVTRLSEVNDGLTSANITIARQHGDQYGVLESQHTQTARELQEVRDAHDNLSAGMEGIVRNEVQNAVLDKDREIAQLRAELDAAKEQIREMQRQILASKANDVEFLTIRDEDYFDNACQQLCQHVQQWVLRFSKFSDMRACRLTSEINNDKTIDRLDNAILDGSDVDNYLADRVKRRDVFMSMTMTMVWEFIFTRYLFGMDREQRQKLKSLEKTLSEVGPAAAVHQWRATTLTLLAKRQAFHSQREQDTQAVVHAVLETLSEILPPPSHLEAQIEEQLTRVMKAAVDLSIEMRCQRAEYMMLPPLQPEYDANGDLASKVSFNAALMNERSGDTVSNEELEGQKAVVRIVLFPLVVKKGDDSGEGDEEIVVCPAQVLVAKPKKTVRMLAPEGNNSRVSMQSSMPAGDSVI
ncbi:hypothetical protein IFR05_006381 [Cadophora sp. M221]|nr:hypothetical protein IFR05_006381 [Cadophora sp. M221]